jgi:hypothetical protein
MIAMSDTAEKAQEMMRVRGETKRKLASIAADRGWKITEAAERAVNALEEKLGVDNENGHGEASEPARSSPESPINSGATTPQRSNGADAGQTTTGV